jgi:hypothetical protein
MVSENDALILFLDRTNPESLEYVRTYLTTIDEVNSQSMFVLEDISQKDDNEHAQQCEDTL